MTQLRRILWLAIIVAALLLFTAGFPIVGRAQTQVTPNVQPPITGTQTTVNNGPGDHSDPHISGNLVSYSNSDGTNFTIRYHDLPTASDNVVPNSGTFDFLSDVKGSVIAFTRVSSSASSIFTYTVGAASAVEVDPTPGSSRQFAQIGLNTIVWQEFVSASAADIVLFNTVTNAKTHLTGGAGRLDQNPAVSSDGTVVAWVSCANILAPCDVWSGTLSGTVWTAHQLTNNAGRCSHPDTNGSVVVYSCDRGGGDRLFWQPAAGGPEQELNLAGNQSDPSIGGQWVAFSGLAGGATSHSIFVYNISTNNLSQVSSTTGDNQLNDVSITSDGVVNVVWQVQNASISVYAFSFNSPVGDFNLSPVSPLTISAGGSGSANVTVNPLNGFGSAVNLSVTGQPNGVSATLSPNSVTPSNGMPVSSVLNVNVPLFLVPSNFTLTVTGTSGTLSHSATANVTVTATTSSITNLIGALVLQGCISNIDNALTSKLAAAQAYINAGDIQDAINTLTALKNQINAQAGKHIATSCTIGGVALNPVTVLLLDVQGLIDSLRVQTTADPITGYVVNASGVGVPGATVSILDGGGMTVATATTDITGYYFFATTNVLVSGTSYTVAVTGLPAGFTTSTPAASAAFAWTGAGMTIGSFVLN